MCLCFSYMNFEELYLKGKEAYLNNNFKVYPLRGKPVRKVAALTRNFSHGGHTFSLNIDNIEYL